MKKLRKGTGWDGGGRQARILRDRDGEKWGDTVEEDKRRFLPSVELIVEKGKLRDSPARK